MPNDAQLPPLTMSEMLGRRVFDKPKAQKAVNKGIIDPKVFREGGMPPSLSMDRMDHAPLVDMAALGDEQARALGRSAFHGWAILSVDAASQDGRAVEPTPTIIPDNPYHADLFLNIPEDEEKMHAYNQASIELAKASKWQARP